jgi:hypothetical protein
MSAVSAAVTSTAVLAAAAAGRVSLPAPDAATLVAIRRLRDMLRPEEISNARADVPAARQQLRASIARSVTQQYCCVTERGGWGWVDCARSSIMSSTIASTLRVVVSSWMLEPAVGTCAICSKSAGSPSAPAPTLSAAACQYRGRRRSRGHNNIRLGVGLI